MTEEVVDNKSDYYSLVRTWHILMEHPHPASLISLRPGWKTKTNRLIKTSTFSHTVWGYNLTLTTSYYHLEVFMTWYHTSDPVYVPKSRTSEDHSHSRLSRLSIFLLRTYIFYSMNCINRKQEKYTRYDVKEASQNKWLTTISRR